MLESDSAPIEKDLSRDYVLRSARTAEDLARVGDLCEEVFAGEDVRGLLVPLFTHHPHTRLDDLLLIEERRSGRAVATLSLIPWRLEIGGVLLHSAEMGIVGTAAAHRGRGLQEALVEQFRVRMRQRGCLLSHIQGIPHFYRRYGYEHALPLEGGLSLGLPRIPAPPQKNVTFREAEAGDLPALRRLHAAAARDLTIHALRDAATWDYLTEHCPNSEMRCEDWVIADESGEVRGYFRLPHQHFGLELTVNEASNLTFDLARAALAHLARLATERQKPGVRLNLHRGSTIMRLARDLGAHDLGDYGWQIQVPDFVALLGQLTPLFEQRIAASPFAALTREIRLNRYVQTIALDFRGGRLEEVRDLGATADLAIRIPGDHLTQLLFGWRTAEELRIAQPEIQIAPIEKMLVDTLFPRVAGFLYTIY